MIIMITESGESTLEVSQWEHSACGQQNYHINITAVDRFHAVKPQAQSDMQPANVPSNELVNVLLATKIRL